VVPAVLEHPDPEHRTIQGLGSTKPNTSSPNSTPSPDVQADERWCKISMVSAFYIVMRGFAFDVRD
jgi:hypothetical protein